MRFYKLFTLSWRRPLSYRNQSTDLFRKSMDWFLYNKNLRHERVWFSKLTATKTPSDFNSKKYSYVLHNNWCQGVISKIIFSLNFQDHVLWPFYPSNCLLRTFIFDVFLMWLPKAATRRCSTKKLFWIVFQNSQENT